MPRKYQIYHQDQGTQRMYVRYEGEERYGCGITEAEIKDEGNAKSNCCWRVCVQGVAHNGLGELKERVDGFDFW